MVKITEEREELKHLGFIQIAALKTLVLLSILYEYTKKHSGCLRSGFGIVEATVTVLVGPAYEKFKDDAYHLLVFFDHKVDEAGSKLGERAPLVKLVANRSWGMTWKASQLIQTIAKEAQTKGINEVTTDAVKKSEHYFLERVVKTWFVLNQVPAFHMVAKMVVPTAAHWSDKYNEVVSSVKKKGYTGFCYLPIVPVDQIAMAFKRTEAEKAAVH